MATYMLHARTLRLQAKTHKMPLQINIFYPLTKYVNAFWIDSNALFRLIQLFDDLKGIPVFFKMSKCSNSNS